MSSFHLTFLPPVALDSFIFGTYATGSHSCSHAELGGHAGRRTVVTPMWGENLSDCLFAVLLWMIDSGLKMMAWHNHLPSQLTSSHELSLSLSLSLCLSLFTSSKFRSMLERHFYCCKLNSTLVIMIMMIKLMINDCWDSCPRHQSLLSALSLTVTPWPFGLPSPLLHWGHSN